jgi:hypothetical protein
MEAAEPPMGPLPLPTNHVAVTSPWSPAAPALVQPSGASGHSPPAEPGGRLAGAQTSSSDTAASPAMANSPTTVLGESTACGRHQCWGHHGLTGPEIRNEAPF